MALRRKKVLICPLDWGLGHATRCIPIIRKLMERNHTVCIASSGRSLSLLRKEFPQLEMFRLTAYNPVYPRNKGMAMKMAMQVPKFIRAIWKEHRETEKIVFEKEVDLVISDNRYGCYSTQVPSVIISHQLNIQMPEGWEKWENWVNSFNHSRIRRFKEVWVPAPLNSPLAKLAENKAGLAARYIGYLSRMEQKPVSGRYRVCAVCSGPEPQRTLLEEIFSRQLDGREYGTIIIKGLTEKLNPYFNGMDQQHIIANYLTTEDLNEAFLESEIIISRPGYSTVMDLAKLGKKAIFIPTPGQTEQQLLADELMKQGIAYSMEQSAFNLDHALKESEKFKGFANFTYDDLLLDKALDSLL